MCSSWISTYLLARNETHDGQLVPALVAELGCWRSWEGVVQICAWGFRFLCGHVVGQHGAHSLSLGRLHNPNPDSDPFNDHDEQHQSNQHPSILQPTSLRIAQSTTCRNPRLRDIISPTTSHACRDSEYCVPISRPSSFKEIGYPPNALLNRVLACQTGMTAAQLSPTLTTPHLSFPSASFTDAPRPQTRRRSQSRPSSSSKLGCPILAYLKPRSIDVDGRLSAQYGRESTALNSTWQYRLSELSRILLVFVNARLCYSTRAASIPWGLKFGLL